MLKKYRKSVKKTQKEMASILGISYNGYRNYENGKRSIPKNIIIKFLELRGLEEDKKLAKILKEFEG